MYLTTQGKQDKRRTRQTTYKTNHVHDELRTRRTPYMTNAVQDERRPRRTPSKTNAVHETRPPKYCCRRHRRHRRPSPHRHLYYSSDARGSPPPPPLPSHRFTTPLQRPTTATNNGLFRSIHMMEIRLLSAGYLDSFVLYSSTSFRDSYTLHKSGQVVLAVMYILPMID